jgi:hypothetical protein
MKPIKVSQVHKSELETEKKKLLLYYLIMPKLTATALDLRKISLQGGSGNIK